MRKGTIGLGDGIIAENQVSAEIHVDDDGEFVVNVDGAKIGHGAISVDMVEWDDVKTSRTMDEWKKIERWLVAGDGDAVQKKKPELPTPTYAQLRVAVQDLLCELRIDLQCLEVMANGYSPDYPGAVDLARGEVWENPYCKVQLSRVVAQKLIGAGVLGESSGGESG